MAASELDDFNCSTAIESKATGPDNAPDQAPAGESPVHFPFEEAGLTGSASANRPSNSETVVEAIFREASRKLRSVSGKSFDALKVHAEVGQSLAELKKHFGHGQFGREVEVRLGLTRQWRARVMKVGEEWPNIMTAIEWAKANNRVTRSEYSVDGALALLKEWQAATVTGSNNAGRGRQKLYVDDFVPDKAFSSKAGFIEFLNYWSWCWCRS